MVEKIAVGEKIGRLTVLGPAPLGRNRLSRWRALCDCGSLRIVHDRSLRLGSVRSCGCLRREATAIVKLGGEPAKRCHKAFYSFQQKCENPRSVLYPAVGGSGVQIHPAWVRNFPAFAADMGFPKAGEWLMRKDTSGDYSPENCVWAPAGVCCTNTRRHPKLRHGGQELSAAKWAEVLGIERTELIARINAGEDLAGIIERVALPKAA